MATNSQTQTSDSVIVRQIVRDTTVVVQADSSMIQALIECDSLGQAHVKELYKYQSGQRLRPPTVIIRDNILTATVITDSLELQIQWLEKELEHYKNDREIITEIKTIETNRLTWLQNLLVGIGVLATIKIIILIIYKLFKRWQQKRKQY